MFTGIVGAVGEVIRVTSLIDDEKSGVCLSVSAANLGLDDVSLGDSIAINGACMTAISVDLSSNIFEVEVSFESLSKTTSLGKTGFVNLEKAMRLSDRLGGHMVSGHVDDVAMIVELNSVGESVELVFQAATKWQRFIADKGSITLHGTSLTVNRVWLENDFVQGTINLIPHTMVNTVFQYLKIGDKINLEIDLLARYIDQLLVKV